jgi:hypothetical protein
MQASRYALRAVMSTSGLKLGSIRRFRHKGIVALFALVALLFATTAYVAHGYQHDLAQSTHSVAHCDLCLQFNGTAGAPDHADLLGKPPLQALAPAVFEASRFSSHKHPTNRLPRGPPALI